MPNFRKVVWRCVLRVDDGGGRGERLRKQCRGCRDRQPVQMPVLFSPAADGADVTVSAPGSFLTVLPDAADSCVCTLVKAGRPTLRRLPIERMWCGCVITHQVVRHTLFAQVDITLMLPFSFSLLLPACVTGLEHTTAQAALDALSARIFMPSRGQQRQRPPFSARSTGFAAYATVGSR